MRWLGIVRFDFVFGADIKLMCRLKIEKAIFIILHFVILLQNVIVKMKLDLNFGRISNYATNTEEDLSCFGLGQRN